MNNVKPVTQCPDCKENGQVLVQKKDMVKLGCPKCKRTWNTFSKTCKKCGKPNGFVVDGPCSRCYSIYYKE